MIHTQRLKTFSGLNRGILRYVCLPLIILFAGESKGSAQEQEPGIFNFFSTKINVRNLDKSEEFYTGILGFKVTARVENDRIAEVVLTRGGEGAATTEQALILYYEKDRKEPLVSGNALNNLLFVFPDLTDCLNKLDAGGYQVKGSREPMPAPPPFGKAVTILFTTDPDRNVIELVQYFME